MRLGQRRLHAFVVGDVNARADVTAEFIGRAEQRHRVVQHPMVFAVETPPPVFHFELDARGGERRINLPATRPVLRMNPRGPPAGHLFLPGPAVELQPAAVEINAPLVRVANPDQRGHGIGQVAEPRLAFLPRLLRLLALGHVHERATIFPPAVPLPRGGDADQLQPYDGLAALARQPQFSADAVAALATEAEVVPELLPIRFGEKGAQRRAARGSARLAEEAPAGGVDFADRAGLAEGHVTDRGEIVEAGVAVQRGFQPGLVGQQFLQLAVGFVREPARPWPAIGVRREGARFRTRRSRGRVPQKFRSHRHTACPLECPAVSTNGCGGIPVSAKPEPFNLTQPRLNANRPGGRERLNA
jgi:hypothetical protein